MSNILIVAPHPDDETLGCGGMIAEKTRAGHDVHVVVLSDGGRLFKAMLGIDKDPTPQEVSLRRKRETERAVEILGGKAANIRYLDYGDGSLGASRAEIVPRLVPILAQLNPAEVYVTSVNEQHPDHRAANAIVKAALARIVGRPALFQYSVTPTAERVIDREREGVIEVDISEFYERKKTAILQFECHLKKISPLQSKPLWADCGKYLHRTETFVVQRPIGAGPR